MCMYTLKYHLVIYSDYLIDSTWLELSCDFVSIKLQNTHDSICETFCYMNRHWVLLLYLSCIIFKKKYYFTLAHDSQIWKILNSHISSYVELGNKLFFLYEKQKSAKVLLNWIRTIPVQFIQSKSCLLLELWGVALNLIQK